MSGPTEAGTYTKLGIANNGTSATTNMDGVEEPGMASECLHHRGSHCQGSSGEEESTSQLTKLEPDVYTHYILETLRKKKCHEKTWRALFLVLMCVVMQATLSLILFRRCGLLISFMDDGIIGAIGKSNKDMLNGSPLLKKACGQYEHEEVNIHFGYAERFRELRDWHLRGEIDNHLDQFRYILRLDFEFIYVLMIMLWSMCCLAEFRLGLLAFRTFWYFEGHGGVRSSIFVEFSNDGDEIRQIPGPIRVMSAFLMAMRVFVCVTMYCCGCVLLSSTTRMIDLILNSMALEFIFTIDSVVMQALVAMNDVARVESLKLMSFNPQKVIYGICGPTGRSSCFFSWFRLTALTGIVVAFAVPHHYMFRSLLSRTQVLCMTHGMTDGTDDSWRESDLLPPVIFPYRGVCESFVSSFAAFEKHQECQGHRMGKDSEFVRASCTNAGDLGSSEWLAFETPVDRKLKEACTALWFGQGLSEGHGVPTLRKSGSDIRMPQMFGCRAEDLSIIRTGYFLPGIGFIWTLLTGAPLSEVTISCVAPAFGPRSRVWQEDQLHTSDILPPEFFYQYDDKSPVERQVHACSDLPKSLSCNHSACIVLANVEKRGPRTCSKYCQRHGLTCKSAAEEYHNTCKVKQAWHCDIEYHEPTADLLCECELPEEKRACGRLSSVLQRCKDDKARRGDMRLDPCRVLINHDDGAARTFNTCTDYCASANLTCVSQYRTQSWSCKKLGKSMKNPPLTCDSRLTFNQPNRVCECKASTLAASHEASQFAAKSAPGIRHSHPPASAKPPPPATEPATRRVPTNIPTHPPATEPPGIRSQLPHVTRAPILHEPQHG